MGEDKYRPGYSLIDPVRVRKDGKTALLIIDMQVREAPNRGWNLALEKISPGSTSYYSDRIERIVIPAIRDFLEYFRSSDLPIFHVTCGSEYRDYRDVPIALRTVVKNLEVRSGMKDLLWTGDSGFQIRSEVEPLAQETVIRKQTWGAFTGTNLDELLKGPGVENLVITGVATHACVEVTARDAADRGYLPILVEDGTATYTKELHEASLRSFGRTHGRVARSASDVIAALETSRPI